jgi:zinc D-Ala-D-Ala carboxypeptidase
MRGAIPLFVIALVASSIGYRLLPVHSFSASQSSPPAISRIDVGRPVERGAPGAADGVALGGAPALRREHRGALGEADGVLPEGATVFDGEYPGVADLDADLLGALRTAARDAAGRGVVFYVTSGWRSPQYQRRLLREAVTEYGSEEEAARWVGTPETSAHVSGEAVDIGSSAATDWLSAHGAEYGLCQVYANEPWHYELRIEATDHGCPAMYADPTNDPRMRP